VLLPWLYAIAGNAVRDQRRSAQRQRRLTGRLFALRPAAHIADPSEGVVLGRSMLGGVLDFSWLPPTPANLAKLRVPVPAGLQPVRLPRGTEFALVVR
jgi:DNA-directed RNA polymerase specialized sigma24 family protein